MAAITIPNSLLPKLGPEMKMDTHWVDVKLRDGRVLRNLVVRGGSTITGRKSDPDGEGVLDFTSDDIAAVRRHCIVAFWPVW